MNLARHVHVLRIATIALLTVSLAIWLSRATAIADQSAGHDQHKPVFMQPSDMKWTDSPAMPAGVKVAILYGDMKSADPIGFRIKIPAGGVLAPHTHPVHERVTVISGQLAMGEGEKFDKSALKQLPPGSVAIFPRGCPMFGLASEETIIQVNAEGPWDIKYINPEDDPRKKK